MNSYLKEIADVIDIYIKLTFHTARHIVAINITRTYGVPMEIISKILRYESLKRTQYYSKVLV